MAFGSHEHGQHMLEHTMLTQTSDFTSSPITWDYTAEPDERDHASPPAAASAAGPWTVIQMMPCSPSTRGMTRSANKYDKTTD
eukprot:3704403-Amphidinium_carterae.1